MDNIKNIAICIIICLGALLLLHECSENDRDPTNPTNLTKAEAYEESYNKGYEEGIQYALETLRENANSWDVFINIDDAENSIYHYYKNDPSIDPDLVRDDILYSGDVEHYTFDEMLEKLIKDSIDY